MGSVGSVGFAPPWCFFGESVARLFLRRDVAAKPVVFRVLWWRGLGSRPWAYNATLERLGQFATYKLADGLVQPVEFGLYHFPCLGEYARAGIGQPVTQFLGEARSAEQGVVLGHEIDAKALGHGNGGVSTLDLSRADSYRLHAPRCFEPVERFQVDPEQFAKLLGAQQQWQVLQLNRRLDCRLVLPLFVFHRLSFLRFILNSESILLGR